MLKVITFGETMLRLSPPNHQLLAQAQSVEMHVGGSESNVAVGLARLGIEVAWFSSLPDNPLGRYVERAIHTQGVDTSHVHWSDQARLGTYWVETGAVPRPSKVIYDRSQTAISQISPDDIPDGLFARNVQGILHLSGITPALSDTAHHTTRHLAERAKRAGWRISFDLNYRAKLWDYTAAHDGCAPLLQLADIIFAPYRDIQHVFQIEGTPETTFSQFHTRYAQATLVMTMGSEGAFAASPEHDPVHILAYNTTAIDRIGAGDAFVAGFLSQVVEQGTHVDLTRALRWANACAALKYTLPGDMPLLNRAEVLALINQPDQQHIQR
ncbi:MAG: PfkB family carbohydrate kinase [Anaerolineae bacterium]